MNRQQMKDFITLNVEQQDDINYNRKQTTINRPTVIPDDAGFKYYDTDIKKYIVWNGTEWTNMDGTSLEEQPTQDERL